VTDEHSTDRLASERMLLAVEDRLSTQVEEVRIAIGEYRRETDTRIFTLEQSVHTHHSEAERAAIARRAQIEPVVTAASWIGTHWRDLLIFAIGILALLAAVGEWAGRLIGPHGP
jgi:hypothetical protein